MFENEIIWRQAGADKGNYRAFLLRCWKEEDTTSDEGVVWRITLVQTGGKERRRGFACLEDLFAFLKLELEN